MEASEKLNVLLVDDEDMILDTLGKLVEHSGWKCFKAPTGEIALDCFKINKVNIVVLDLNLPAMDGFEVLQKMKAIKPEVPVIILTGQGYEKEQIERALKLGASGYVSKAMPVRSVISKIRMVLGQNLGSS